MKKYKVSFSLLFFDSISYVNRWNSRNRNGVGIELKNNIGIITLNLINKLNQSLIKSVIDCGT